MIALATFDANSHTPVGYPAHRPDAEFTAGQIVLRSFVTEDGTRHAVSLEEDGLIGQLESEMIRLPNTRQIWQDETTMLWHDGREYLETVDFAIINRRGVFVA